MTHAAIPSSASAGRGPSHSPQPRAKRTLAFLWLVFAFLIPAFAHAQQSQTITFTQPPPSQAYAGTSVILAAIATSGLPVTFSVVSGPAQVSGTNDSTLTFTGVGNVIVQANQPGNATYAAAPPVQSPAVTVTLLTEPVTTPSAAISTVVIFTTSGTLDQISALTQGAPNLDFTIVSPITVQATVCSPGLTYTAGQTCSLAFAFTPTHPGIRYGGITLSDSSGNLLANAYIYGYGVGPQVLYNPVVQSFVGSSLGNPSGVATNAYGDIFVSNDSSSPSALIEVSAAGVVSNIGTQTLGKDVAVDGSGNVFFATADTLYEAMAVNGVIPANPTIRTLTTGLSIAGGGIAVDGSGNAFIANGPLTSSVANPTGVVYEVLAVGGIIPSNSPKITLGPLFAGPTGVVVDSSGNVYVSDGYVPAIYEMLAVNGSIPANPTVLKLGTGYVGPSNIRIDDTNDIFISDSGLPGILEFVAVNNVVAPNTPGIRIGSGFLFPQGLSVDDAGDVYVSDGDYTQIVKLNFSTVPTLNFASTFIGQTSTDSPKAVTYTNAGNAPLLFTTPATGTNPTIVSNTPGSFTLNRAISTCPQIPLPNGQVPVLDIGASCTDKVSFTPQIVGPQTGTLTTIDNNLSVPNATQIVPLNGTGISPVPTIVFTIPTHFVDDPPFTVSASSNSTGAFTYSYQSGPASLAGNTVTLTGATGSVTILATQAAASPYITGSAAATFAVVKHNQTIDFTPPTTPVPPSAAPVTLVATATSGLPVTFSIVSGPGIVSGNQLTFTGPGTIVIAANQPGNNIYNPAPQVTQQLVVLDTRITITLTGTPNPVFLYNPIAFAATVTSPGGIPSGTVTFLDGTTPIGTSALSGNTSAFSTASLTAGLHSITAVYSGDGTFATATSAPLSVLVEDFALTISNPNVTISHGGTAVFNLTVTTVGGAYMAANIQFASSGSPDASNVTFSPAQVVTGSGTTNFTLTIQTPDYPVGPWGEASITILAATILLTFTRKRRIVNLAILAVALAVATTLSGCGWGWGPQNYPITVTASSGALSHSVAAHLRSQ